MNITPTRNAVTVSANSSPSKQSSILSTASKDKYSPIKSVLEGGMGGSSYNSNVYSCNLCDFKSTRQNVMIFHRKSHNSQTIVKKSTAPSTTTTTLESITPEKRISTTGTRRIQYTSTIDKSESVLTNDDNVSSRLSFDIDDISTKVGVVHDIADITLPGSMSTTPTRTMKSSSSSSSSPSNSLLTRKRIRQQILTTTTKTEITKTLTDSDDVEEDDENKSTIDDEELLSIKTSLTPTNTSPSSSMQKYNSEELRKSLLADWSDEDNTEEDKVKRSYNTAESNIESNPSTIAQQSSNLITPITTTTTATTTTIRNIPKKDRRNIVLKEFNKDNDAENINSNIMSDLPPNINEDNTNNTNNNDKSNSTISITSNISATINRDSTNSNINNESSDSIILETDSNKEKQTVEEENELNDHRNGNDLNKSIHDNDIEIKHTAKMSCFDFRDEEEEEEDDDDNNDDDDDKQKSDDALTSIAKYKKKYIFNENTATAGTTISSITMKTKEDENTQRDNELTAEINNLLEQTTGIIPNVNSKLSLSGSKEDLTVKDLPIKERGKRIFKSRNKNQQIDENNILTDEVLLNKKKISNGENEENINFTSSTINPKDDESSEELEAIIPIVKHDTLEIYREYTPSPPPTILTTPTKQQSIEKSPTIDENSSAGAEFGSPTSMLDDERSPLIAENIINNNDNEINNEGNNDKFDIKERETEVIEQIKHTIEVNNDDNNDGENVYDDDDIDDDEEEIESPPHEELSGNELDEVKEQNFENKKVPKITIRHKTTTEATIQTTKSSTINKFDEENELHKNNITTKYMKTKRAKTQSPIKSKKIENEFKRISSADSSASDVSPSIISMRKRRLRMKISSSAAATTTTTATTNKKSTKIEAKKDNEKVVKNEMNIKENEEINKNIIISNNNEEEDIENNDLNNQQEIITNNNTNIIMDNKNDKKQNKSIKTKKSVVNVSHTNSNKHIPTHNDEHIVDKQNLESEEIIRISPVAPTNNNAINTNEVINTENENNIFDIKNMPVLFNNQTLLDNDSECLDSNIITTTTATTTTTKTTKKRKLSDHDTKDIITKSQKVIGNTTATTTISMNCDSAEANGVFMSKLKSSAAAVTGGRKQAGHIIALPRKLNNEDNDDIKDIKTKRRRKEDIYDSDDVNHYDDINDNDIEVDAGNLNSPNITKNCNIELAQQQLLQLQQNVSTNVTNKIQKQENLQTHCKIRNTNKRINNDKLTTTAIITSSSSSPQPPPATTTTTTITKPIIDNETEIKVEDNTTEKNIKLEEKTEEMDCNTVQLTNSTTTPPPILQHAIASHYNVEEQPQLLQIQTDDPSVETPKILAVPTLPIPNYRETFLLCTVDNNNYKPIDNVPLYLDHDLNQLVPVPAEILENHPNIVINPPMNEDVIPTTSATFTNAAITQIQQISTKVNNNNSHHLFNLSETVIDNVTNEQIICTEQILPVHNQTQLQMANIGDPSDVNLTEETEASTEMVLVPDEEEEEEEEMSASANGGGQGQNGIFISTEGQNIVIDTATLAQLLANPDGNTQLVTDEGTVIVLTREILAALMDQHEAQQAIIQSQQLSTSPSTDLLAVALAGSDLYDNEMLEIETSQGLQLLGTDGNIVFQQGTHLTPPITAHTSETNALLDQTPIMSILEKPSTSTANKKLKNVELCNADNLDGSLIQSTDLINCPRNLEDSLAVIGVHTQSSSIPTSLELPITITNPAIAPKVTLAPSIEPLTEGIIQLHTTSVSDICSSSSIYNDPGS